MKVDTSSLTISKARKALDVKEFSARDLAQSFLDVIAEKEKDIHAYLEVYSDVLAQADEADKKIEANEKGALLGIPLAIKDNILIEGRVASAASKMLEKYRATYDATVIKKLKKEGAIFLGRTNMDEFAMGGSTENSAFGATKNPHDPSRVPGGSSGGSAAAVAAAEAIAALGSDTGGSIRQPAAFCGIVGLKPTYGAFSRFGLVAMGSSLDQIGPMTRTVEDAKILFEIMAGKDAKDSTTGIHGEPLSYGKISEKMKLGVPTGLLEGCDEEVKKNFEESVQKFKSLGYEIRDIILPNLSFSLPAYYVLMPAEVSANLARYDGVRYGAKTLGATLLEDYEKTRGENFGPEVRRRIILGTYVLSAGYYDAYYHTANIVRKKIANDFLAAFGKVDAILLPTSPTPAFKIGEKTSDPLAMYLADIFTVSANLAGIPAISVPSGFSEKEGKKLPLGLQILSSYNREDILFRTGKEFLGED